MKQITIAGNITKDAELRRTQGGDSVLGFSIAVNDRDKTATFFDCSVWGKRATALEPYLTKGTFACVTGAFSTREYEGKTYLQVNAGEIAFTGGNRKMDDRQSGYRDEPRQVEDMDDEIPF